MKKTLFILFSIFIQLSTSFSQDDVVLIHGWLGDGSIWNGTALKQVAQIPEFQFNRILQPSLNGTATSGVQAINLHNYLVAQNVTSGIGIAYSMGALNSRYYSRLVYEASEEQRLQQFYTIGGTHFGTRLANNRLAAVNLLLVGAFSILYPGYLYEGPDGLIYIAFTLEDAAAVAAGLVYLNPYFDALINLIGGPAVQDLEEGSGAVNYINGSTEYESNIIKVGIAGTEIDPVLYRMLAPYLGASEESMLLAADHVIQVKQLLLFNAIINYVEQPSPATLENMIANVATLSVFLSLNEVYKSLILESDVSDGIVSQSNQIYPNYDLQYFVTGISHEEEKYSEEVADRLTRALTQFGNVTVSAPSSLMATNDLPGHIRLTWMAVPDASSYVIYRNTNVIGESSTTSYSDNVLGTNVYNVSAIVGSFEGPFSNPATGAALHLASYSSEAMANNNQRKIIYESGMYHLTFESHGEIWYTSSANGTDWSPEELVSNGSGCNRNPSMAVTSAWNGIPFIGVTWEEFCQIGTISTIYARRKNLSTGSWLPTDFIYWTSAQTSSFEGALPVMTLNEWHYSIIWRVPENIPGAGGLLLFAYDVQEERALGVVQVPGTNSDSHSPSTYTPFSHIVDWVYLAWAQEGHIYYVPVNLWSLYGDIHFDPYPNL